MAKKTSKRKTLNILEKNKKHSQFDYTEIKLVKQKQHYLLTLLIFLQQNIIEFY